MIVNTAFMQNSRPDARLGMPHVQQINPYSWPSMASLRDGLRWYRDSYGMKDFYLDELPGYEALAGWGTEADIADLLKRIFDYVDEITEFDPSFTVAIYQWFGYWDYGQKSFYDRIDAYCNYIGNGRIGRIFACPSLYRLEGYPLSEWKSVATSQLRRLAKNGMIVKPMFWHRYHGPTRPLISGPEFREMHYYVKGTTYGSAKIPTCKEVIEWGGFGEDWDGGPEFGGWWAEVNKFHLNTTPIPVRVLNEAAKAVIKQATYRKTEDLKIKDNELRGWMNQRHLSMAEHGKNAKRGS